MLLKLWRSEPKILIILLSLEIFTILVIFLIFFMENSYSTFLIFFTFFTISVREAVIGLRILLIYYREFEIIFIY